MLNAVFKRKKGTAAEKSASLPSEVLAALDAASITERSATDEGAVRVLVQIGAMAFHHGAGDAQRLREAFSLDEATAERAASHLRNRIGAWRNRAAREARGDRSGWASWRPAHSLDELPK